MKKEAFLYDLLVIGGGAAGFFAAIVAAEQKPGLKIAILEQGNEVLGKVKISGGGRCNVTHACFDVKDLIQYYPRGQKELQPIFYRFNCENTIEWFKEKGVKLKTENDGRVFPITDSSQTIINCFLAQIEKHQIKIIKQAKVLNITKAQNFTVHFNQDFLSAQKIIIATGSNTSIWKLLQNMGHSIVLPVPSLFTFNIKSELLKGLEGVSLHLVQLHLHTTKISSNGALLITHTGLSGPAILKLSAFAARILQEKNYQFKLEINWLNESIDTVISTLKQEKEIQARKQLGNFSFYNLPHRFWLKVLEVNGISSLKLVADISKNDIQNIAQILTKSILTVHSKNTNKDEFVTAGGVDLKEVNFKTMESKLFPNLYFAGEVLNIDAVTGGFNFQAAWTTGYIAACSIAENI
ncbi:MAG TPA: NAD(P)/FAD-dependent oxidoreductase [Chitinophagales bacterium]|nr:NAD(P)/FAD-dependent oxidoreductase [Chitinophagales bacterium]HNM32421.1 NAD(P)/FAD-dependent oxidoreductase [Chitinophagales bacterium]